MAIQIREAESQDLPTVFSLMKNELGYPDLNEMDALSSHRKDAPAGSRQKYMNVPKSALLSFRDYLREKGRNIWKS